MTITGPGTHVARPLPATDLAAGHPLGLDSSGRPHHPVLLIDLDSAASLPEPAVRAAARAAADALPLTVGLARTAPPPRLRPLTQALTFTLVAGHAPLPAECVVAGDLDAARDRVLAAAAHAPQACLTLNRVLRQTPLLDVRSGLAAEAAAYSMLLGGAEFRRWLEARGPARPADPAAGRVRLDRRDATLAITLARPHRRNAMDALMREALIEALEVALLDDTVERVELTGAGPGFCSGGDLDEFGSARDHVAAYLVRLERHAGHLIHLLRERVHARLHGACYGAGVEMPLFARHVTATPDAVLALPEIAMGLIPGAGGTVSVPARAGRWRTAWMAVTGARLDAATALEWGLIDAIETMRR
ncbi:hypothetical protein HNP84_007135 [Thermocatellispora tengchongensis]|uniref:Enoyl-CoA hydratase/isomerase family protein n=1 Tax=Thermocatellispora tengchongensis TaxID=1073253 RepID=A0A840PHI9_9ACTN|nr:enoyl-CoA hydratase/isomerase family protein [Thermocatellispora tengchongensis]MBB5137383.1 hypothetical protein [Thermocatellispora tengchongensis]